MLRMIVILSALAGASLFGQVRTGENPTILPAPGRNFEELRENLGLTTFQLEQLMDILREKNAALLETYKQIAQKESELYSLLNSGSQDLNRIGKLTLDIHTLRTQQPPNNQFRERALAVLAPDQKAKLEILEQALRLSATAYQAVTLNLIDGAPVQILPVPSVPRFTGSAEVGLRSLP